jgi:hypothetical protein
LQPRNVSRETQYLTVVDVVDHADILAHARSAANGSLVNLPYGSAA